MKKHHQQNSRLDSAATRLATISWLALLPACDALWGGFTTTLPPNDPCSGVMCAANQVCNATSGACESPPPLRFDSITPNVASMYGGTQVTIKGGGLAKDTLVTFGGLVLDGPVFEQTGTSISGTAPKNPAMRSCRTPVDLTLSNPRGEKLSYPGTFNYLFDPFTSNSLLPSGRVTSPVSKVLIGNIDGDPTGPADFLLRTETGPQLVFNAGTNPTPVQITNVPVGTFQMVLAKNGPTATAGAIQSDLVFAYGMNHSVYFGQYTGKYMPQSFDSGDPVRTMVAADLNQDGIDEVIVSTTADGSASSNIYVYNHLNYTSGWSAYGPFPVPNIVSGIAAVDLGGDPNLEIVLTSSNASALTIFGWDGKNIMPVQYPLGIPGLTLNQIIAADFDGDRKTDLAFLSNPSATPTTLIVGMNRPLRWDSFSFQVPDLVGTPDTELLSFDMNCDGRNDIVLNQFGPNPKTLIYYSNGGGMFIPKTLQGQQPAGAIAIGDLNGDSFPDLVVGRNSLNMISMLNVLSGNK